MKIGIVGLGHLGKIHLKLLSESSSFNVSCIFDINNALTKELAAQYQVYGSNSYDDFLKQCDAVCVVTPTPTHFELVSKAIKQGKHVFIEKPATPDVNDTKKLISLAREANVIVQVGHVERFNPAFTEAKPYIHNPILFDVKRLACYNVRGTDVSVVMDLMIHDIDLVMSSVKSKIKRISAVGYTMVSKTTDIVNARLEFENGCVANLTANRVALKNVRDMQISQQNGYISVDLLNKTTTICTIEPIVNDNLNKGLVIDTGESNQHYQIVETQLSVRPTNAIKAELDCFYESITKKTPIAVSLNDAEIAILVAQEIENQINK
jgi:predicted dehydrogenase